MNKVFFKKSSVFLSTVALVVSGFLMFANYQIALATTGGGTATIAVDGNASSSGVTVEKSTAHIFTTIFTVNSSGYTLGAASPTFTIPDNFTAPNNHAVATSGAVTTEGMWSVVAGTGSCVVDSAPGSLTTTATGQTITVDITASCAVGDTITLTYKGTSNVAMGATQLVVKTADAGDPGPVTALIAGSPTITVDGVLPHIPFGGHNLYISPVDSSSTIVWGGSGTITGATSLTDGATNTVAIVSALGGGSDFAAGLCSNLTFDGYSDWYLPAYDQLFAMYTASSTVNKEDYSVTWADFAPNIYWSSTEAPGSETLYAGITRFSDGGRFSDFKTSTNYVRCVRSGPTSNTANTNLVLGLVGTSANTSNDAVATAAISGDGTTVDITSEGAGTATITVTAANGNQMTIAVIVAADGTFTSVTPAKWIATTNFTTANPGTLGITATTATSSAASIVTADTTSNPGFITITSVALGTAVITLTADNGNQAIINVIVAANGSFAYGPTAWTAKTNSNTANTDEILGLVGTTTVSSNTAIATTSISGGNIDITSVGVGAATITVSDGTNSATISVTVDATGAITIGTITPYLSSDASLISVAEQSIIATGTGTQGSPKTASISVANAVQAIYVEDVVAATSATSSLYSDSSFTTTARPLVLDVGDTHAYIKVVAEDDTTLYYDVTIARAAATTYTVTAGTMTRVSGDDTSTVEIDATPVVAGATVTLTVVPKTGMQLQTGTLAATYNGTATTTLTNTGTNAYTFTMPAYAVTVTATFVAITCSSVSNAATYNTYPTCGAASCNSGYVLSNDTCVASGGGGGGGGGNVTPACTDVVYGDYSTACFGGYQYRSATSRTPSNCALTAAQQEASKRVCSTPADIKNVNVNSNEPPATPATITPATCNICQKLTYDVYIINPDGSERHTGTPWVRITDWKNGIKRYSFEDKTLNSQDPNYDYNDFVIDVDFKNCQSVKFIFVSSDAAWKHQVRVKVLVNGLKQSDILIADDSRAVVGTFKTVNAAGGVDTRSVCPAEPIAFASSLKGKILLQVQAHGEAWYVNPLDGQRYYLANGDKAYDVMRNFGIGITNKNLEKIKSSKTFAKNNSGKIFLQVESRGEAYYIDFNGIAHYLKDGAAAYEVMGSLGLGITNSNLDKITEGNL